MDTKDRLYLFLLRERNPKRIFSFMENMKATIAFSVCFAASYYRGSAQLSSKSGTAKLLPWELHSASWASSPIALNCVCEQPSVLYLHLFSV